MDVEMLTDLVETATMYMSDKDGNNIQQSAYVDLGDIFFRSHDGTLFQMTITEITADQCDFIDEADWS